MKTIAFDAEYANKLELAISSEFGCNRSEILSLRDSFVKKVTVFILFKTKDYDTRVLGANYQISWLYIPTVIKEIEYMLKVVPGFEIKIKNVYQLISEK
ncbi:hypothetical protein [Flavobacterium sp. SLB02]|uniref:hypothetical protein n=1 Tax=Flavobacterium sp. SLB02 TaxID=2665645 RepID=UPI0012A918C3|nr:hypothetical protein [Flavobacterium sp. SLB02]QGK72823.1 hypothetical protein GIY83_01675 [Flavobacterium sp. SLB02]